MEGNSQMEVVSHHPIIEAAIAGDVKTIETLLQEGVVVDYQNENGWTPSIFAVEYHRYEALLYVFN